MSEIGEFVAEQPLFDTHEHQLGFSAIEKDLDKLDYRALLGYAKADVVTAAGGPVDLADPDAFFRTWAFVRTTGYGQATEMSCRALTGLDFTLENVAEISAKLRALVAGRTGREIYEQIFSQANIRWAICDRECWDGPLLKHFRGEEHPAFFGHVLRFEAQLLMSTREPVERFEQLVGRSIQTLGQLDQAMDDYAEQARKAGKLAGFKCALAYFRRLNFENSSFAVAEALFEQIMQGRTVDSGPLQDYLFHRLVQRAGEMRLPMQIHTGYLAGNWGDLAQGDPTPLAKVFQRYRNVRFDVFHAGWPYCELMGALGKEFPNVYLDLCWAWAMNPVQIERVLDEWLGAVPHNKIFAFGGDVWTPYEMIGEVLQARQGITRVLERRISAGEWTLATAKQVAGRIMHENARALYGV